MNADSLGPAFGRNLLRSSLYGLPAGHLGFARTAETKPLTRIAIIAIIAPTAFLCLTRSNDRLSLYRSDVPCGAATGCCFPGPYRP